MKIILSELINLLRARCKYKSQGHGCSSMKYLLSDIQFKTIEKGQNKGEEYVLATVSNADCDVDTKTTRVALFLVKAVIEAWKQKIKDGEKIIREGQFFTVNNLPNFYKKRYGSSELITDANGTPIVYNSLEVFSFIMKKIDEHGVEAMRPINNVRETALQMISQLFQLATVGPTEAHEKQDAPDERDEDLMPNGQPFPPQINTPEKRAEFLKVMGLA